MAAKYTLTVGIGSGWALQEVVIEARLVERRGKDMALYELLDGRHILHIVDGDCHSILEVSETGRQRIDLDEYLNRP